MLDKDMVIKMVIALYKSIAGLGQTALQYAHIIDSNVIAKVDEIASLAIRPVASVLFALFAVMQIYKAVSYLNEIGAPQGGSARIEVVGLNLAKIGFIYWVIQNLSNLMWSISSAGVYLIESIETVGGSGTDQELATMEAKIQYALEDNMPEMKNLWEMLTTSLLLLLAFLVITIATVVIFVLFYGRLLQLYIMIALAPLPLVTLIHEEQKQIGINFLKSFVAVVLQGAIMMASIYLYTTISWVGILTLDSFANIVWSAVGVAILLIVALATSGTLARRIANAM